MIKKIGIWAVVIALIVIGSIGEHLLIKEEPQDEKVCRVDILSGFDTLVCIADCLKAEMTELDYIEGKNIAYDIQKTNFEPDKEQQILEKFVDDKVDLIFTFPTEVSLAAKTATQGTSIPVVFSFCAIDYKLAQELGLTVPEGLLAHVDEVIY